MRVELQLIRGALRFVFLDSEGAGLPLVIRRGQWRAAIYRPPFPVTL